MNILFLSPRQAWPANTGAKQRDYHLAQALGRSNAVTYVHFGEPSAELIGALGFCKHVVTVPQPQRYTPAKIIHGLFGRWPLPIINYASGKMSAALLEAGEREKFDLIQIDGIHMASYLPILLRRFPGVPIVFDFHNIESELMRRYSFTAGSLLKQSYARITAQQMARSESWALARSLGVIVCSERERDILGTAMPDVRIAVIPNGVDTAAFQPAVGIGARDSSSRDQLIFVGSMDYHANVDAALDFSKRFWPGILARNPSWTLTLVGSNPIPEVLALGKLPGIVVTGTVDDTRPYYQRAVAAIVPVRTGGGTRLKILEAMAAGVPVISTTLGAEGLDVIPGCNLLIADDESGWNAATAAVQNASTWVQLATSARRLAEERYNWAMLGSRLQATYSQWLTR